MRFTRIAIILLLGIILVSGLSCRGSRLEVLIPTPTPTPTPMPSPTPTMLFSDNFSDPSSGWYTQSYKSGGSTIYKDGWFHIRDHWSSYSATTSYAKQYFTDFILEVEGKLVDGQVLADCLLQAKAEFEDDHGWDLEDALALARNEGPKYDLYLQMGGDKSPAARAWLKSKQDTIHAAELALLKCAKYSTDEENWYIVSCRSDRLNNYYTFAISAEGRYFIERTVNGDKTFLKKPQYSTRIYRGKNVTNLIHIECVENTLSLSVNGHLLAKVRDDTFTSGDIELGALIVEAFDTEVAFDNIVVTTPYTYFVETTPTPIAGYQTYTDYDNGFSMSFPEDWEVEQGEEWFIKARSYCTGLPSLLGVTNYEDYPVDVQTYFYDYSLPIWSRIAGYTSISVEDITLDGAPAIKHLYTDTGHGVTMQNVLVVTVKDYTGWEIMIKIAPDCWNLYENRLNTIINSFRFLD